MSLNNPSKRKIIWSAVIFAMCLIIICSQFSSEVQWNETIAYCVMLSVLGGAFELWQWLKTQNRTYRFAFGTGLFGIILIGWANGAVGIIGSENNPANLLYVAVFLVGLIGSLAARLRAGGMVFTLIAAAIVQFLIPFFALFIWPAKASWGEAGVIGVIVINSIFAMPFVVSALLFNRATKISEKKSF